MGIIKNLMVTIKILYVFGISHQVSLRFGMAFLVTMCVVFASKRIFSSFCVFYGWNKPYMLWFWLNANIFSNVGENGKWQTAKANQWIRPKSKWITASAAKWFVEIWTVCVSAILHPPHFKNHHRAWQNVECTFFLPLFHFVIPHLLTVFQSTYFPVKTYYISLQSIYYSMACNISGKQSQSGRDDKLSGIIYGNRIFITYTLTLSWLIFHF